MQIRKVMLIVLVSTSYLPKINGAIIAVRSQAQHLKRMGYSVCILTRYQTKQGEIEYDNKVPIIRFSRKGSKLLSNLYFFIAAVRTLSTLVKRHNTIVHAHGILPGLIACYFTLSKRASSVVTFHQMPKSVLSKLFFKLVVHFANAITAQSQIIGLEYKRLSFRSDWGKITIIPNQVDITAFNSKIDPMEAFHLKKVLFVGNLGRNKGVDVLILAMKDVVKAIPNATLDIVGSGRLYNYLVGLVNDPGLRDRVRFLGALRHDDVVNAYDNCSVLVLPSYEELFPNVILEASLMARPVIATSTIGAKSLIQSGKTGLLVNIGDVHGIARAIITLLSDEKLYMELSKNAREHILNVIENESYINSLIRLYSLLIFKNTVVDESKVLQQLPSIEQV